jgi:hypothetical protein
VPRAKAKKAAPAAKPRGWARPVAEITPLVRRAESGDAAALAETREMLTRAGTADALGGNLAREAIRILVRAYAPNNPFTRDAVTQKLDELRAELLGADPTSVERLLVERVVAAWLHLHHLEVGYACQASMSLALGLYYQKCISAAQKRYLAAIKGLAEVRKLALPTLQLNIAKKQINVAAGPPSATASGN